jgi:hypothetical protein
MLRGNSAGAMPCAAITGQRLRVLNRAANGPQTVPARRANI